MKRFFLFFILLIFLVGSVNSVIVLEFEEGDYINVRPEASDPDADSMTYFFENPLSNKGEWQTNFGDEGIYNTKVTVSDGRLTTVEEITLIVKRKEMPPTIEIVTPEKEELFITEGEDILFDIDTFDLNNDEIDVEWYYDDELVGEGQYYIYYSDFYSSGEHEISVRVSDGKDIVEQKWFIEVENFDRVRLFADLKSITVDETEIVMFELPDFEKYNLEYEISEPMGNDGKWQTTYDDAGVYSITINAWDEKDFSIEKTVKVLVENVDRPPSKIEKDTFWFREGDDIELPLEYIDLDGDEVVVKIENLPEGAVILNNILYWTPDHNTVKEENFFDSVAKRYNIMSKGYDLEVVARSRDVKTDQIISLRVFNYNRNPEIIEAKDIVISEGETIEFDVSSVDPDDDELYYQFKGLDNNYQTKKGDRGTYLVKIIVSDGFLSDEEYVRVKILPSNQEPVLEDIGEHSVNEGEQLVIELNAEDEEELEFTTSFENGVLVGNKFFWKPDFDTVNEGMEEFLIPFTVSDGEFSVEKEGLVKVKNVNRMPEIIGSSQIDGKRFYLDEEVEFSLDVYDADGDEITYEWQIGLFDRFEGDSTLEITFNDKGKKRVRVTASDGKSPILVKNWEIRLEERPKVDLEFLS